MDEISPMIFFVTAPNYDVAQNLAYKIIEDKIGACVNILKPITSIYRWKDKIEKEEECLMIIKTASPEILSEFIKNNHPYEVPECVGFEIQKGLPKYMEWIVESSKLNK